MRSLAQIAGVRDQLQQLLDRLVGDHPDLSAEMNQRGELVCCLSTSRGADHWVEVEEALGLIGEAIAATRVGDLGILVETRFDSSFLPDGSVMTDEIRISQIGLEAMARVGADLEITVNRPHRDVGD